ncbi:hypothetical protein CRE_26863 [Caenorhabditis remanei]|uniref:Uncharacterized protein n=1 Tax=Caenorhabditis remanei TaxID=31234 RepID=E3NMZ4_CAERE|nr:hypothetical protein CRE_26863 [Caenorhabditis remanei]
MASGVSTQYGGCFHYRRTEKGKTSSSVLIIGIERLSPPKGLVTLFNEIQHAKEEIYVSNYLVKFCFVAVPFFRSSTL